MLRLCLFWLGVLLVIVTPLVGVIPGPGGIFVFAAGVALMLRNSHWAKRRFVHTKRRWPKMGHYADIGLRRASARRRRERDKVEGTTPGLVEAGALPLDAEPTSLVMWVSFVVRRIKSWGRTPGVGETQKR